MKESYKFIPHSWVKRKDTYREMCGRCGLVRLRTKLTDKAVKLGCMYDLKEK